MTMAEDNSRTVQVTSLLAGLMDELTEIRIKRGAPEPSEEWARRWVELEVLRRGVESLQIELGVSLGHRVLLEERLVS
jgi:hypothetical protein